MDIFLRISATFFAPIYRTSIQSSSLVTSEGFYLIEEFVFLNI